MAYKPRILNVEDGGSGRSSATAYAVKCGGTTTTGAEQSIASVGTLGQVLTSNGAGVLPTMQTLPSSSSSFSAYLASKQDDVTGDGTVYTLGTGATLTILDNTGSNFTTSGVFTAPATGKQVIIKDNVGSAGTNNITVTPNVGNIDGSASFIMNANYASITIVYNGTEWSIL